MNTYFYNIGCFQPRDGSPHGRWNPFFNLDSVVAAKALGLYLHDDTYQDLEDSAQKIWKEMNPELEGNSFHPKSFRFYRLEGLLLRSIQLPSIGASVLGIDGSDISLLHSAREDSKIMEELKDIPMTYSAGNTYTPIQAGALTMMFANWASVVDTHLIAENYNHK